MLEEVYWTISILIQTSILITIGTDKTFYLRTLLTVFTIYRFRSFIKIISWIILYIIFSYIYTFTSFVLGFIIFRKDVSQKTKNKIVIAIVMLQTFAQPNPGKTNMEYIDAVNNKVSSYFDFSDLRHALRKGLVVEEFHPLRFVIILFVLYAYVNRTPGESLFTTFQK